MGQLVRRYAAVDMLVDFVHEHRGKFSEEQRDRIVKVRGLYTVEFS
jgi:hypothetical protein